MEEDSFMAIHSINPATGEKIHRYEEASSEETERMIQEASRAFEEWRRLDFSKRVGPVKAAADLLREGREDYARLMAAEMGKPIAQGRAETEKCAHLCDYFAENAAKFLTPEMVETEASKSFVIFEPLGVVLAVMPWNFPLWQVFRAAIPALMAGNAMLLKHASNVPGCAIAIEKIFRDAGFPAGLFNNLLLTKDKAAGLIDHPLIQAATLTGSVSAGREIAARAGKALKKVVLELGGSDPYVVLEDADMETAAEICVQARLINSGQSCIAAKRFIVVEPVLKKFEQLFVEKMRAQKTGDPLDESVTVGPMARDDLRRGLHAQVERSVSQGAKLLLGGEMPAGKGFFYPPTVLAGVRKGIAAFDEETFGPVAAIIQAADEAEAVLMANDSSFGLGAAVFTGDNARGERIAARELRAGSCFVNAAVMSDPRLPFGGIKDSGYGRELSVFGIREFVNVKTVYIK
jgi:succinate-semialdehyde dehydrogenase/glutarate-semialdehyde dehydrogenase